MTVTTTTAAYTHGRACALSMRRHRRRRGSRPRACVAAWPCARDRRGDGRGHARAVGSSECSSTDVAQRNDFIGGRRATACAAQLGVNRHERQRARCAAWQHHAADRRRAPKEDARIEHEVDACGAWSPRRVTASCCRQAKNCCCTARRDYFATRTPGSGHARRPHGASSRAATARRGGRPRKTRGHAAPRRALAPASRRARAGVHAARAAPRHRRRSTRGDEDGASAA